MVFLVPEGFPDKQHSPIADAIAVQGGRLVSHFPKDTAEGAPSSLGDALLVGLQYNDFPRGCFHNLEGHALLRGGRHAVVYVRWVEACLLAGRCVPVKPLPQDGYNPHTAFLCYDPLFLDQVHFTTTQVPPSIKFNLIALLQFYGAHYSPHLRRSTTLVVYMPVWGPPSQRERSGPSKLEVAKENGITCVSLRWMQDCLQRNLLLPEERVSPSPGARPTVSPDAVAPSTQTGVLSSSEETTTAPLQAFKKERPTAEERGLSSVSSLSPPAANPSVEELTHAFPLPTPVKRGRGRPAGGKKDTWTVVPLSEESRKRGRPRKTASPAQRH
ncbi:hypothetical protein AGDE_13277 [Angomonas deanei]|uniref:BRCA1 C Terminus (BRCT) domain/twin BRCT domain containing protein, putative n=1 Tax=Angomonas deanei TaxID=59799 RepID=A0A7G2C3V5_9TRYP|nr:hypothetical protein AGDE_13277 [Angomonas deanei]CAD2214468.1 BRCA1 C Terminus (BRCT) domain/twin BRCT domain containing protein, putative [Angomonas deanei]|eukprot:EPY22487.1 hypothetical protein AGDE_13277 [Angomonas deanei]